LIGADRIDLGAGHVFFILTPFLLLAPLTLLIRGLLTPPGQLLTLSVTPPLQRQFPYLAACSLFLIFAFASIPLGLEPERGYVAFGDLLVVAVLGYLISVRILEEPEREKLILRSITFGLGVYAFFCVGECIAWAHGLVIDPQRTGSWLESTFAPSTVGPWVPNLSGTTFDANRSGFILTMYLMLLDQYTRKTGYTRFLRWLIAIFVFLAISRSGMLCWMTYYLCSRAFWRKLATRRVLVRVGVATIGLGLLVIAYQKQIENVLDAWEITEAVSAKMSMDPGSSGESHILLIERGLDTWLRSKKTIVAGIGYAAAPKVLQDFFGDDKRGNFHNLYVTTLAEMGLPAFLVMMFILVYPVFGRQNVLPCIAAIMAFNISYQSHTEPVFWMALALMWSQQRKPHPVLQACVRIAADTRTAGVTPAS
jgi:O-antigen ligase